MMSTFFIQGRSRMLAGSPLRPNCPSLQSFRTTSRPYISNCFEQAMSRWVWSYDIVNLDYFGPFLPVDRLGNLDKVRSRTRTEALLRLFHSDRLDARNSWVLLITVDGQRYKQPELDSLRDHLSSLKQEVNQETIRSLDFLLGQDCEFEIQIAKLIHGVTASLVATAAGPAGLQVYSRGTVSYRGANDRRMTHMAFEFEPTGLMLGTTVPKLPLFRAPILRPLSSLGSPWFGLIEELCTGTTPDFVRGCLNFLDQDSLGYITADMETRLLT